MKTEETFRTRYEKNLKNQPLTIADTLKEFRTRFDLTQVSAAQWLFLPTGTYRDYEQGRSNPAKIIEAGIHARIADYARRYEEWIREKEKEAELEPVAS